MTIDPIRLAQDLIRCPSVTPLDAGALDVVESALAALGFQCWRLRFEEPGTAPIDNLYARRGDGRRNLCFAGHTDVVPVGDAAAWTAGPFEGELRDGQVWGRGAADMKGAIAAWIAACARLLAETPEPDGSISLLITGDEEASAINGTRKVLGWLRERGERLDACIVGEPTNPQALGDVLKIGRRGSMTGYLTVHGTQGHSAYPERADNPLPRLVRMLAALTERPLDSGTAHFPPSTLALTTIDVGNPANNVIPAAGRATFNIRFNDAHSSDSLKAWIKAQCDGVGGRYDLAFTVSGESFVTQPGPLTELMAGAVEAVTGRRPAFDTGGGTSDARFIKDHCPVVEFGLVGATMHKVDERVAVSDIEALTRVYHEALRRWFA
ncbi:MAG TPA: succinyl-diaminopimelate desuccinylase [Alphaproteobacteria bacterium]|nr:succinyl-diaminopimelate desuccinylase [Alphaproteobacteria bacterium]